MTIAAVLLDLGYDYGHSGGPTFDTSVSIDLSGRETRNSNREDELGRWELGERNIDLATKNMLLAFFRARRGREIGFLLKDWIDYQVTAHALSPDGSPTVQFAGGGGNILYPVAGSHSLTLNSSPFSGYSVDTETGIATLTPDATANISAITQAADGEVTTSAPHGYSNGDEIYISGAGGMTEINGQVVTVASATSTTFLTGVNTSAYGAYTSGGTADKYVQSDDELLLTTQFYKPVRFDSDSFIADFLGIDEDLGKAVYFLHSLPVVEIRE